MWHECLLAALTQTKFTVHFIVNVIIKHETTKQFTNKNKLFGFIPHTSSDNLHLKSISKTDLVYNKFVLKYIPPEYKAVTLDLHYFLIKQNNDDFASILTLTIT
jgi:hypothetical protein